VTTPFVTLRPIEDGDLPIFFAHQSDPVAVEMAVFPSRTPEAFFAHWATIRANPTLYLRTILADGVVVGNIGSWPHDDEREVGYWIGREWWGRGIATAALRLVLEEVADRPLVAHVARGNVGSRRVLEHCGFAVSGAQVGDDGVIEDILQLD
jgi:RimJ/RimL family protein N-acetyltransferase